MKLLFVDGDQKSLMQAKEILTTRGYMVEGAKIANEALNIIDRDQAYDLIFLDTNLPDFDGYITCQLIRTLENPIKAQVPIVFMTNDDTIEGRNRGFSVGAANFLLKDEMQTELFPMVERILRPPKLYESMRALIIDNSPTDRHIIRHIIQERGLTQVQEVDSDKNALQLLRSNHNQFNLIIISYTPPYITGRDLTEHIRQIKDYRDVPIILISATDALTEIINFYKNGGSDFICRPFISEEFSARIAIHLDLVQSRRQNTKTTN